MQLSLDVDPAVRFVSGEQFCGHHDFRYNAGDDKYTEIIVV